MNEGNHSRLPLFPEVRLGCSESPAAWLGKIPLLFCLFFLVACSRTSVSPESQDVLAGMLVDELTTPIENHLVWIRDDNDLYTTFWIRGNQHVNETVAQKAGLVVSNGGDLFELSTRSEDIFVCDCKKTIEAGNPETCVVAEHPIALETPIISNMGTGETTSLFELDGILDDQMKEKASDIKLSAVTVGSFGPYLIYQISIEYGRCDQTGRVSVSDYFVYNIVDQQAGGFFTDEELLAINENERELAFKLFSEGGLVHLTSSDDLKLTKIEPVLIQNAVRTIAYQFTASNSFTLSDSDYSNYSRTVKVSAQKLPAALVPYALLPKSLMNVVFFETSYSLGGWTSPLITEAMTQLLQDTFAISQEEVDKSDY